MPELPEVETIRNDLLEGGVIGRQILSAKLLWPGVVQRPLPEELVARLSEPSRSGNDRVIRGIGRRGKYLILRLGSGDALIVHLGMSGRLLLRRREDAPDPYLRAVFALDDGRELRFCDLRKFGKLWLVADEAQVVRKLGPEPLEAGFTPNELARRLERRGGPLKAILLDQALFAGLGNIYADEALFVARLHPLRRANRLSPEEVRRLHAAIRQVLVQGIANRGTTFSDYQTAHGQPGQNQLQLRVYRRTGEPCPLCEEPIQRIVVGGRSSHFCPRCQRVTYLSDSTR